MVPMFPRKSILQARKSAILPGKSRLFFQILEKHKNTGLDNYKKTATTQSKKAFIVFLTKKPNLAIT
jgi:hypothetical protein